MFESKTIFTKGKNIKESQAAKCYINITPISLINLYLTSKKFRGFFNLCGTSRHSPNFQILEPCNFSWIKQIMKKTYLDP